MFKKFFGTEKNSELEGGRGTAAGYNTPDKRFR
jgi:hypothetical protein